MHERMGRAHVARPDMERRNERRIRVERDPRPHVASLSTLLQRDVLLLGVNERPNLVALNPLARQVAHAAVLLNGADRPQVYEELDDRVLGYARHLAGGTKRVALDKRGYDGCALLG